MDMLVGGKGRHQLCRTGDVADAIRIPFDLSADATQRLAVIGTLVPIATGFGPSWTSNELLPLLVKQVRVC